MARTYTLGTSIAIFIVTTLIYFALKTSWVRRNPDSDEVGHKEKALQGMYFLLIMIMQYIWNFSNAAYICGSSQSYFNVLFYTLVPNFFIFATVLVIITVMPGWLTPFSNTIGYAFVYCMGLTRTFNDLLAPKGSALITKICSDVSILINEMTIKNYSQFMATLKRDNGGILKKGYKKQSAYFKLYHLVALKQIIAEALWYIFAGCLVISTSFNAINNMGCTLTTSQMRAAHAKLKEDGEEAARKNQEEKPLLFPKTA